MWRHIRSRANTALGVLPYSVKVNWGIQLAKKDGYSLRNSVPHLEVTITSLDYVWNAKVRREEGRFKFEWTNPRAVDKHVNIAWSVSEGWTIRGTESGRRTRPLPKLIAAVLCGTLVWVSPDLLEITLQHAEGAKEPAHVYLLLATVTLTLAVMIGVYMWFCYKAQPTGLDKVLKGFGRSLGRDDFNKDSKAERRNNPEIPSTQPPGAGDDGNASLDSDKSEPASKDSAYARDASQAEPKDGR